MKHPGYPHVDGPPRRVYTPVRLPHGFPAPQFLAGEAYNNALRYFGILHYAED